MNEPKLNNKECLSISNYTGIDLRNTVDYKNDNKLVMKVDRKIIDTVHSFNDKRYLDIAEQFSGKVLIFGLGFGFSILHACANPKVKSVTVVEMSPHVVTIFHTINGFLFEGYSKLKIVILDAMEYEETDFDHLFFDIIPHAPNLHEYNKTISEVKSRFEKSVFHFINLNPT